MDRTSDILIKQIDSLESLYLGLESALTHGGLDPASKQIVDHMIYDITKEAISCEGNLSPQEYTVVAMESVKNKIVDFIKKLWFNFMNIMRSIVKRSFSLKSKLKTINNMASSLTKDGSVDTNFSTQIQLHNYSNLLIANKVPSAVDMSGAMGSLEAVLESYESNPESLLNVFPDMTKLKVDLGVKVAKQMDEQKKKGISQPIDEYDHDVTTKLNKAIVIFKRIHSLNLFQDLDFKYDDGRDEFKLITDKKLSDSDSKTVDSLTLETIRYYVSEVPGVASSNMLFKMLTTLELISKKIDNKALNRSIMEYVNRVDNGRNINRDYFLAIIKNYVKLNMKLISYTEGVIRHLFDYMIQSLQAIKKNATQK